MSNNKDFKVRNGIQPTSYFEGVGTVVSAVEGYVISNASYDSKSFSTTSQETQLAGVAFSNDGTSMYIVGNDTDFVYQYDLSTAFDVSTASISNSFNVSGQDTFLFEVHFNSDGTKMYVLGATNNSVFEYTLSTAFDISTASYTNNSFSVASQSTSPRGLVFSPTGDKMYMTATDTDTVYQYSLSTPFSLSTASYDSISFNASSQETTLRDVAFNADGSKMFLIGNGSNTVYQYSLSTPYNVGTASYDSVSFSVLSQDSTNVGITFGDNGKKMYIVGYQNTSIFQYSTALNTASLDLSTGSVFDYTPTSNVQVTLSNPAASGTSSGATLLLTGGAAGGYDIANATYDNISFSTASQDTSPQNVEVSPDGTKLFMVGEIGNSVYQYSFSTPFDLSTLSYDSVSFSIASQSSGATGLTFKPDGLKFYVTAYGNDAVYQYSMSTAYDLSTASYDSVSFSVASQDTSPDDVLFNNDGTKMYVVGSSSNRVHQYSLSSGYDLSTASYDSVSLDVSGQTTGDKSLSFNSDGTKLFVAGTGSDAAYQYSLSTAYDLSTASYDSVSFDLSAQDTIVLGVTFANNGTKMYMFGSNTDSLYQYSTVTPATITYDPNLQWSAGTAPTAPAIGETDVITFNTTDGGTTYTAVQAIDGAS